MDVLRKDHLQRISLLLNEFPVVTLLGARQVESPPSPGNSWHPAPTRPHGSTWRTLSI